MVRAHRTVDRIASILESVTRSPDGETLGSLARQLDAPKTSIHALIQGLLSVGYLSEKDGRYSLGPAVELLVNPLKDSVLQRIAQDELDRLSKATGETAQLGVRIGDSVVLIDQVQSSRFIRYVAELRQRRPMLTTSIGKIFLAELDGSSLRAFFAEHGITEPQNMECLSQEMEEIRQRAIAFNREESVPGIFAVGAGVRDASGKLVAAISIAGPSERVSKDLDHIVEQVRETANRTSGLLRARREHVARRR